MWDKSYRKTEICPICDKKLEHYPSYHEVVGEVEYGLDCEECGTIDYFAYGSWEGDIDLDAHVLK